MKRVLVSVKSVQRDMDGKDTVVELISPGTSHEKGNAQYVRYEESSVTGLDGVKTTIKIHDDSIVLLRTGAVNMRHQYVLLKVDVVFVSQLLLLLVTTMVA